MILLYTLITGLVILFFGSVYLIVEGYRVYKIFQESIIGKLVKTLVVVLLVELYSLGVLSILYLFASKFQGVEVVLPIAGLWILSLLYAIVAIRTAKKQVTKI